MLSILLIQLYYLGINKRSKLLGIWFNKKNDDLLPAIFYTVNRGERWSEFILPVEEDWEKSTDVQVQLHATNMDSIWIVLSRSSHQINLNIIYTI